MIARFPDFSTIRIEHKEEINNFTFNFEPYSDSSFVNLFAWNVDNSASLSWLNGNLIIRLPDYIEKGRYVYSLIGINDLDTTVETLLSYFPLLSLVPQIVINNLKSPEKYAIAEDRDNFDYLYKIDDLASLQGSEYRKKRQKVNRTHETLKDRLELSTQTHINNALRKEMEDVLARWQVQTEQPIDRIELEGMALRRLLDHFYFFDLHITTCRIDGRLEGFSINEVLDEAFSICHFEKSITSEHDGTGSVLINHAAKSLSPLSTIVNWEQDLGIPGLKKSKLSYKPIKYHRKYWISRGEAIQ